jgi:hypothetical protein
MTARNLLTVRARAGRHWHLLWHEGGSVAPYSAAVCGRRPRKDGWVEILLNEVPFTAVDSAPAERLGASCPRCLARTVIARMIERV